VVLTSRCTTGGLDGVEVGERRGGLDGDAEVPVVL